MLREPVRNIITWYNDGNVKIELGSHIDGFAVAMLFVVSFISFCVHVFSREYLRTDSRFVHYFASLALFTAAMLWMVQSATTLGLLFGWEMMGLCSFLLIGHWWEDNNNSTAAVKVPDRNLHELNIPPDPVSQPQRLLEVSSCFLVIPVVILCEQSSAVQKPSRSRPRANGLKMCRIFQVIERTHFR